MVSLDIHSMTHAQQTLPPKYILQIQYIMTHSNINLLRYRPMCLGPIWDFTLFHILSVSIVTKSTQHKICVIPKISVSLIFSWNNKWDTNFNIFPHTPAIDVGSRRNMTHTQSVTRQMMDGITRSYYIIIQSQSNTKQNTSILQSGEYIFWTSVEIWIAETHSTQI